MEINEKVELIDKFLQGLSKTHGSGTVPEIIDGFQKFPSRYSDKELKYRIIEGEIIALRLAEKIGGGDNSVINGYFIFKLSTKGIELVESQRSVSDLYNQIQIEESIDSRIKEYSLEKLEFEKTIREQDQRIRDLSERLALLNLIQKYWWLLLTILGLGYSVGKWLRM
jgi:hypothetical protein